jgi:hypothetical protein
MVEELKTQISDVEREIVLLRRSFSHRTWAAVAVAVALVIAGGLVLRVQVENDRRIRESEQKLCPIVSLLIPQPGDPTPAAGRPQLLAGRAARLAQEFECPPEGA